MKPKLTIEQLNNPDDDSSEQDCGNWDAGRVRDILEHIVSQNLEPLQVEEKLKQLKTDSGFGITDLRAAYKRVRKSELSKPTDGEAQDQIDIESLFTDEQKLAAAELANCRNLFDRFEQLVDSVGYVTDRLHSDGMLLTVGLTKLPTVSYVCYMGDTSSGKTRAAEIVNAFIDHKKQLNKLTCAIDVSQNWIKYAGGPDGRALQGHQLFLDELNPSRHGEDDYRQSLMRQMDSEVGEYVEFKIVDRLPDGSLGERTLRFYKPVHFLYTSITLAHKWDKQTRNRTYYLEFSHDEESLRKVFARLAVDAASGDDCEANEQEFEVFNYFLHRYVGVDPASGQRITKVKIPFFADLTRLQGDCCGSDLRRLKLLKKAISVSALLHSKHRKVTRNKRGKLCIEATWEDFYNIKAAFEAMVPRVTKPAGQDYLKTFRKIAPKLYESSEAHPKLWLKEQCTLSDKAVDEHPNDLCAVGLLKLVRKEGENKNYYVLGPFFYKCLEHCKSGDQNHATAINRAIDMAISEVEQVDAVGELPRPSESLKTSQGESEATPDGHSGQLPQYLTEEQPRRKKFREVMEQKFFSSAPSSPR